jgi:hypothetical protein
MHTKFTQRRAKTGELMPGERQHRNRTPAARHGCALRWASCAKLVIASLALALIAVACRHPAQVRHQPPTATQIQQKIVGTWFLDSSSQDGTPETIIVVFGADGSFESSRNFTDFFPPPPVAGGRQTYRAMWQATDGYFTVTKSNSLPNSSLQMFVVDYLDDHEMVCGHPSVAGRDKFKR